VTGRRSDCVFGRLLAAGLAALMLVACSEDEPAPRAATDGAVVALRRLTPEQYANIIADVFGPRIKVVGSFDPLIRTDGLMAVSAAKVGMTPPGFEQFDAAARAVAAQVVEERNRATLIPCAAAASAVFDHTCAQDFFTRAGRLLLRRPLTDAEVAARVTLAENATRADGDFAAGLATGLASLLTTPAFLYVTESVASGAPDGKGRPRLDDFSIAARLSFLLWNTTPDDSLLADAERGVLSRPKDLARQVDRMLASPRLYRGVRAFFADMLALEKFAVLEKDTSIYPSFSLTVAQDGREQILRTITEHLLVDRADYRDLFTTRRVFLSDTLARLYKVPAPVSGGWGVHEFPDGDPRAGIQTAFATTALFSHPGRSSPTLRGRAIRENFLCQRIPDPPGDVDFTLFSKAATEIKTARQRLDLHNTEPACAGCHKLMDPVGLSLENFDGVGQMRTTDGGAPIDTSGSLDGVAYADPAGMAQALRQSPALPACLVTRLYTYGLGRSLATDDQPVVTALNKSFSAAGYRLPDLLRAIAVNPRFIDAPPAPAAQLASR
jgi:hypothetical protein